MNSLQGKHIYLEFLQESYIDDYLVMFSLTVQKILGVSSIDTEKKYLQEQLLNQSQNKTIFFCIFELQTHSLIGALEIRSKQHRGQLCTWLHENYWGKGYFKEAFILAKTYYFTRNPKEKSITARVDVSNIRSYNALKNLGCTVERISAGPRGDQYEMICV